MVQALVGSHLLQASVTTPEEASGLVVFVHGSGSSRHSPRNVEVARRLNEHGFATLLFDLLTEAESSDRRNIFDIPLLANRTAEAIRWARAQSDFRSVPIGLFGASTGAAAALVAAAYLPREVAAVVSRGGRPDLAEADLPSVRAPTLLIVGEEDRDVLELNRAAQRRLNCQTRLVVIPRATHLFEEPGALDQVVVAARSWFETYFKGATWSR